MKGKDLIEFIQRYDLEDVEIDDGASVVCYGKYRFNFAEGIIKWDEYVFDGRDVSFERSRNLYEWLYDWYDKIKAETVRDMVKRGVRYEVIADFIVPGEWDYADRGKVA